MSDHEERMELSDGDERDENDRDANVIASKCMQSAHNLG